MKGFVGATGNEWFAFLSQQTGIDEANFLLPPTVFLKAEI